VENHAVVVTVEDEDDEQSAALAITWSKAKAVHTLEEAPSETISSQTPAQTPASEAIRLETPDLKRTPAFRYESKAVTPDAAKHVYEAILNTPLPHLTISDLLSISPDL
jgi:hypothetical protein